MLLKTNADATTNDVDIYTAVMVATITKRSSIAWDASGFDFNITAVVAGDCDRDDSCPVFLLVLLVVVEIEDDAMLLVN